MKVVLGEMDVAWVNPCIPVWLGSNHNALSLVPTPSANGGHLIPRSDLRSASYPVNDVHQARIA